MYGFGMTTEFDSRRLQLRLVIGVLFLLCWSLVVASGAGSKSDRVVDEFPGWVLNEGTSEMGSGFEALHYRWNDGLQFVPASAVSVAKDRQVFWF